MWGGWWSPDTPPAAPDDLNEDEDEEIGSRWKTPLFISKDGKHVHFDPQCNAIRGRLYRTRYFCGHCLNEVRQQQPIRLPDWWNMSVSMAA